MTIPRQKVGRVTVLYLTIFSFSFSYSICFMSAYSCLPFFIAFSSCTLAGISVLFSFFLS